MTQGCPVERSLKIIGGKWTILIVHNLLGGAKRFGELRSALGGVSSKMLAQRLRELERDGIVKRHLYPEVPLRVEYELTEKGLALQGVVEAIRQWGEKQPPVLDPLPAVAVVTLAEVHQ